MRLSLSLIRPTHVAPTPRVLRVAAMFGLGVDETRPATVVPPIELTLGGGQVVFITGASGGGKSSLLKLIAAAVRQRGDACVVRLEDLPAPPDRPLVDCLAADEADDAGLRRALDLLSRAGLADAFALLRTPAQLSDGQRYRLRLAQAMEMAEKSADNGLIILLADEFAAALDRVTAQVVARQIRKWTRRSGRVCFIAATTHDDLLEALDPDVLIEKGLGGAIEVCTKPGHVIFPS